MILVSIRPFALRKIFLIVLMLLCFSVVCFADPVLMVRRYAPAPEAGGPNRTSEFQDWAASDWDTPRLDAPSHQHEFLSFDRKTPDLMFGQTDQVATG